jgi:hypothetical protein
MALFLPLYALHSPFLFFRQRNPNTYKNFEEDYIVYVPDIRIVMKGQNITNNATNTTLSKKLIDPAVNNLDILFATIHHDN